MSAPVSLEIFFGFAMFALVFVTLEHCVPAKLQNSFRPGWATDVMFYIAGCFVGHLSDAVSLGAMLLIREAVGLGDGLAAGQPYWIQFLEILVLADFLAYVFHRTLHTFGWLWRLHKVHHSSPRMDWLANVRLHPVDKLMGDCFQFIPIFFLGFANAPLMAYTIFLGFQGFLNHSNVRLNYGPLGWIIATPQFHHWHHSNDPVLFNKNFSPHLVIFDRLFGTFYLPDDQSLPEKYGLSEPVPESFWGQLTFPWRGPHGMAPVPAITGRVGDALECLGSGSYDTGLQMDMGEGR